MRAIKYKYALALNLSIVENEESMIKEAIEQAKNISEELVIQINLYNPFNKKSCLIDSYSDSEKIFNHIK
jgi:hypothetical protein